MILCFIITKERTKGADSSAIIYSIIETAKANHLRVYDYLELLLTELPKHADDTSQDFIQYLLPWSEFVQEKCGGVKKSDIIFQCSIYEEPLFQRVLFLYGTHDWVFTYIRPIVRGKAVTPVEFGAKMDLSPLMKPGWQGSRNFPLILTTRATFS